MHSAKVYIYGAVQKPGLYHRSSQNNDRNIPLTLADIIAESGGIKYDADTENIRVINTRTGKTKSCNLLQMIKKGDASRDIYLTSEEKIYVPSKNADIQLSDEEFLLIAGSSIAPLDFPVRVNGAVRTPGIHRLNTESPRLHSAIAVAGGYTFGANTKAARIKRITPKGNISTIIVNPDKNDPVLRPDDIVFVSIGKSTVAGKHFGALSGIAGIIYRFFGAYNECNEIF